MEALLRPIKRALISVSDKSGVVEFAKELEKRGVEILSTGGTAKLLDQNGVKVIEVSDYTKFPEMMDGRVKTLHPMIHGGILGRRGIDEKVMAEHNIKPIDLVVVNLYPFVKTVSDPNCPLEKAIENIDIGGPTMVRAAAKNNRDVAIVVRASDYDRVIKEMDANDGSLTWNTRFDLAIAAFEHTAAYDSAIANYFGTKVPDYGISDGTVSTLPRTLNLNFKKLQSMRYGENPHQKAAFYSDIYAHDAGISTAKQLQGKELSYNNIGDTDGALETFKEFDEPTIVAAKHANPCGVGSAETLVEAYRRAYEADPVSIFGGIVAANREIDAATATEMAKIFLEVIVAPSFSKEALEILTKKKNLRLLQLDHIDQKNRKASKAKTVLGG